MVDAVSVFRPNDPTAALSCEYATSRADLIQSGDRVLRQAAALAG